LVSERKSPKLKNSRHNKVEKCSGVGKTSFRRPRSNREGWDSYPPVTCLHNLRTFGVSKVHQKRFLQEPPFGGRRRSCLNHTPAVEKGVKQLVSRKIQGEKPQSKLRGSIGENRPKKRHSETRRKKANFASFVKT